MKIKYYLYILLLISSSVRCYAQSAENQYLDNMNLWTITTDNIQRDGSSSSVINCLAINDSTINGKKYRRIIMSDTDAPNLLYLDINIISEFWYRDENKKIYRYDESTNSDILLYDFSLTQGQEIVNGDGVRLKVTEKLHAKDIIETCESDDVMAYRLIGTDDELYEDVWVEGLGSIHTGILRQSDFPNNTSTDMVCGPKSYNSRFTTNDKIIPKHLSFNYEDIQNIEDIDFGLNFEFIDDTLHVYGITYFKKSATQLFRCHLEDEIVTFSVITPNPLAGITTGVDIYSFDVKFSGFAPGTYTIKTKPYGSNPEYEDTTLVCPGPVSGIKDINEDKAERAFSDNIYDLSGRRLSCPPERGIYIQGGRVRVK